MGKEKEQPDRLPETLKRLLKAVDRSIVVSFEVRRARIDVAKAIEDRPKNATPLLIDAREAGHLLDMLPARVSRLAKRGDLPCVVLPDGELRYLEDDLRNWVKEYRRPAAANGEGKRDA